MSKWYVVGKGVCGCGAMAGNHAKSRCRGSFDTEEEAIAYLADMKKIFEGTSRRFSAHVEEGGDENVNHTESFR